MSNPGGGRIKQESLPSSSNVETRSPPLQQRPPLNRDSSVLHAVGNFCGFGIPEQDESVTEEKTKWEKKRLRRLASAYKLNQAEVSKFAIKSLFAANDTTDFFTSTGDLQSPLSPQDDLERGTNKFFASATPSQPRRVPLSAAPSLPNQPVHHDSTSSEHSRIRGESFSQSIDQSRFSKSRLKESRESVPSALFNSAKTFFKKGSFVDKNKLKLKNTLGSKCSFDVDSTFQEAFEDAESPVVGESPSGITFSIQNTTDGQSFEMKPMGPVKTLSPKKSRIPRTDELKTEKIAEETSFELEVDKMTDIDEAQVSDIDPSAIPRMKTRVRKKSSARSPAGSLLRDETTAEREALERSVRPPSILHAKTYGSTLDRPSDLAEGTRPLLASSKSLPSDAAARSKSVLASRSFRKSRKKGIPEEISLGQDELLGHLAAVSEQKDFEESKDSDKPRMESRGSSDEPRFRSKKAPFGRSMSIVDEVFFDAPAPALAPATVSSWIAPQHGSGILSMPIGMPPPELDSYHPDLGTSPPTSADPVGKIASYTFDPDTIKAIDESEEDLDRDVPGPSKRQHAGYRQEAYITRFDVGDAELVKPARVALGKVQPEGIGHGSTVVDMRMQTDRPWAAGTLSREEFLAKMFPHRSTSDDAFIDPKRAKQHKLRKIMEPVHKMITEKAPKRKRGIDVFGKFMGRELKEMPDNVKHMIEEGEDERVWFTWWVTTIQFVVCILSLLLFPLGPIVTNEFQEEVLDVTLSYRRVSYFEPRNIWIGPAYADLIRLGAKYSPCMRREPKIWDLIEEERHIESRTGCCIGKDRAGCYQSSEQSCPRNVAQWVRWDKKSPRKLPSLLEHKSKSESNLLDGAHGVNLKKALSKIPRTSGAVCGQDPAYCEIPLSIEPFVWPDNLSQWPICEKRHNVSGMPDHMTCEVTGRPCCIQLQGLCRISTKEYCDFVKGAWHENATLCGQVDCFRSVCGLFPSITKYPSQVYRLFTSLFIHAGILHFLCSFFLQIVFMRDVEKLIGATRMAILYIVSGVGGNLASAIFVPFYPEVGPSASQCGVLAAIFVDIHHHRALIENVREAYFTQGLFMGIVFVIGLVPWVDNWANLFGAVFGLLTTIIIFPYIDLHESENKDDKVLLINESRNATSPSSMSSPISAVVLAETPMTISTGYSQIPSNTAPSPDPISLYRALINYWSTFTRYSAHFASRFMSRRAYIALVAFVIELLLFLILFILFFANVEINCQYCTYLNCIPFLFDCENQGQRLRKWLPI